MKVDPELEQWQIEWQSEPATISPELTKHVASQPRRGRVDPVAHTTTAFLAISIRRCRAVIALARSALLLYFCAGFAWIYRHEFAVTPPFGWTFLRSGPVITVALATAGVVVGVLAYTRAKTRELRYLQALEEPAPKPRLCDFVQEHFQERLSRLKRRRFEIR